MTKDTGMLDQTVLRLGDTSITGASIIAAALVFLACMALSLLIRRAIRIAAKDRVDPNKGTLGVVTRMIHYSLVIVGFVAAMQTLGINLGVLFGAGAIFAVGLAFAMQSIAQNFVAGVILLAERAIKPGDILAVDGKIVEVQDMGIRATIVTATNGERLVVPNSTLIQNTVTNYTLKDPMYRIDVIVGVGYDADTDAAKAVLMSVVENLAAEWKSPRPPEVLMTDFADSSIVYTVSVWTGNPWNVRRQRAEMREHVWKALGAAGVVIPFKQIDLHVISTPKADPGAAAGLSG